MRDDNAIYLILKKISFDEYVKAVGEYKAYMIIEQEIQDLQNEEKDD